MRHSPRDNSWTLLFLLYINDLPNYVSYSHTRMYADDTHSTYADNDISKIELNLNQDIVNVSEWFIGNKLTLKGTLQPQNKFAPINFLTSLGDRKKCVHNSVVNCLS